MKMINIKSLLESIATSKASSDTKGKLHEILVGAHLNNDSHMSPESEAEYHKLKQHVSEDELENIHKRAFGAAQHIYNHLKDNGHKIHSVHWTSKPGDIGRLTGTHESQQENPSDIMIKTKSGHHIGYSLKVSDKMSTKVPVGNPGHGKTDEHLGTNTKKYHDDARKELHDAYPHLKGMSQSEQKAAVKADPKIYAHATKIGAEAIKKVRDDWHESMSNMHTGDLSNHIRHNLLHAHDTKTPMFKASSGGTDGEYKHSIVEPGKHYDKYLNDHKNLHVVKSGNNSIEVHHIDPKTGTRNLVVRHRLKFESTPVVTTMKGSAEGVD